MFRVAIPKGFVHLPPDAVRQTPVDPVASPSALAHAAEATRWNRRVPEVPAEAGRGPRVSRTIAKRPSGVTAIGAGGPATETLTGMAAVDEGVRERPSKRRTVSLSWSAAGPSRPST